MKTIVLLVILFQFIVSFKAAGQSPVDELNGNTCSQAVVSMLSIRSKDALSILPFPGYLGRYEKIHLDAARVQFVNLATGYSVAMVIPIERDLTIGFAATRISNQGFSRKNASAGHQSQINLNENFYLLSIGRAFRHNLSIGINMKALQQRYSNQLSNLVPGLDVGMTYKVEYLDDLTVSAAIENFSQPEIEIGAATVVLPRFYRLAVERPLELPGGDVIVISSLNYSRHFGAKFRMGIEYSVGELGCASVGWDEKQQLAIGGKFYLGTFQLSVAHVYTDHAGFYSVSLGYAMKPLWF